MASKTRKTTTTPPCTVCNAEHAPYVMIRAAAATSTAGQGTTEQNFCGPCYLKQD